MKSLLNLHLAVLHDAALQCSVDVSKDVEYISRRYEDEGDSFLTITLPKLAKALEKGLAAGFWPSQDLTNFRSIRGLPVLLRGFLTRIFAPDGVILSTPDPDSIWAVRQFCYLTHKVNRPTTPEREQAAFDQYWETDAELAGLEFSLQDPEHLDVYRMFSFLFSDMLSKIEIKIDSLELVPKHGPGSTADRLRPSEKWDFEYWTERMESVFPSWFYRSNLASDPHACLQPIETEIPVKVISVPKTMSTPRIIAMEPASVQYAQQALKREFQQLVEHSELRELMGFVDQTRNQKMAREGSLTGHLATLDLSEASDRLSWSLVQFLFRPWPSVLEYLDVTRSRAANVGGVVRHINKFASMGSALTFPVETMVFLAIAASVQKGKSGRRYPSASQLAGRVSVYGDDIILPAHTADLAVARLGNFGFKVNSSKSFWTGLFRESCGAEWFNGTDVSVIRLRADLPRSRDDALLVSKATEFRNRCYNGGLWSVVRFMDPYLDMVRIPSYPSWMTTARPHSGLVKDTFLPVPYRRVKYHEDYQELQVRVPHLKSIALSYEVDGDAGLLKWFHENEFLNKDLSSPHDEEERPHAFSIIMRGISWLPSH